MERDRATEKKILSVKPFLTSRFIENSAPGGIVTILTISGFNPQDFSDGARTTDAGRASRPF